MEQITSELIEQYFTDTGIRREQTKRVYRGEVNLFEIQTDKTMLTATAEDAGDYMNYMLTKYKTSTIYKKLRVLNAVYTYLAQQGICSNIFGRIAVPEREIEIVDLIPEDRIEALLAKAKASSTRDFVMILFAYRLGLHGRDIAELKISNLKLTTEHTYCVSLYAGSKKEALVALPADMHEPLSEYLAGRLLVKVGDEHLFLSKCNKAMSYDSVRRMLQQYDSSMTFNEIRKLAAVKMAAAGVEKDELMDVLGIGNTWIYRYLEAVPCYKESPAENTYICSY